MTMGESKPTGDLEALVLSCAREILQRDDIGPGDNFFDKGGDSLAATYLLGRLREETGAPLRIRLLFEEPDFASVSQAIKAVAGPSSPQAEAGAGSLKAALGEEPSGGLS